MLGKRQPKGVRKSSQGKQRGDYGKGKGLKAELPGSEKQMEEVTEP
jgi:hypothetical protein